MSKKKKLKIDIEESVSPEVKDTPGAGEQSLPLFENTEESWDPLNALTNDQAVESDEEDLNEIAEDLIDSELLEASGEELEEGFFAEETHGEIIEEVGLTEDEIEEDELVESVELRALTDDEATSIIESLLFISDRPVGLTTFKNAFEGTKVNTKKIKELIAELQGDFAQIRRGVTLEEIDGAFQIRTKVDNQEFIKKIVKAKTFKLTGPSLETLSVIAYKQPCVKSDVDEVRGVESGHLVRALMDKGLVTFAGKSELPGKPMLYKTTRKFLEIFGLRNINELPSLAEMEELLPEGIDVEEDKQTLSDLTGQLSENYEGNYSVAEDELGKITEQLEGISTRTEFFDDEKRKQKEKQDREKAESISEALVLGEEVETKDRKWLERYEAKLLEAQSAAQAAAAVVTEVTTEEEVDSLEILAAEVSETETEGAFLESLTTDSEDEVSLETEAEFDTEEDFKEELDEDTLDDLAYRADEESNDSDEETSEEEDPLDLL